MLDVFASAIALLLICLVILYWSRYKKITWGTYIPKIAWVRGGIYFCFCYLLSYATGGMELILTSPIVTAEQWANPNWRIYTFSAAAFIVAAYAGLWCYYTPIFERPRHVWISAVFGFLWGSSSGQLFLSVWLLASMITEPLGWPTWATWIIAIIPLAAHQPNWHNIYWDHYIAPEHDTPMTQIIKASCCHVPNITIMLTYLALYENYLIFVTAQVVACTSAAIGMRFPAPWDAPNKLNLAARTDATPPRCTGYVVDDYKADPYTPFYPGWHGGKKDV